jgi:hypothetical protein
LRNYSETLYKKKSSGAAKKVVKNADSATSRRMTEAIKRRKSVVFGAIVLKKWIHATYRGNDEKGDYAATGGMTKGVAVKTRLSF